MVHNCLNILSNQFYQLLNSPIYCLTLQLHRLMRRDTELVLHEEIHSEDIRQVLIAFLTVKGTNIL